MNLLCHCQKSRILIYYLLIYYYVHALSRKLQSTKKEKLVLEHSATHATHNLLYMIDGTGYLDGIETTIVAFTAKYCATGSITDYSVKH